MQAQDGFSFGSPAVVSNFMASHGVGLAYSPSCGRLFLGFSGRDPYKSINVAYSTDGVNWAAPNIYSGWASPSSSGPVLVPDPSGNSNEIGVAWTGDSSYNNPAYVLNVDCDGANPTVTSPVSTPFMGDSSGAAADAQGRPAWATNGTAADIRAYSDYWGQHYIYWEMNDAGQASTQLGANWSNVGPSLAVDPSSGNRYICWLSGSNNDIIIQNMGTGTTLQFSDWSDNTPAMTVYNGKLFVVWRGGNNNVNVASLNLF
jgi:hypothetical protein